MRAAHPTCTLRYNPRGDLTGEWDASRLRQLLSNLIGNAIQHGAEGCEVRLSVNGEGADGVVVLAVHNQGPAIPAELLPTIFDPLVRAVSPELEQRGRPGSIGLGLYIAREVVHAHGGTIDA
jgi:signal transduction histidine kinase